MPGYILLLYSDHGQFDGVAPDAMMQMVKDFGAWVDKMRAEKRLVGGDRLNDVVQSVARKDGRIIVTDGPYAESKEIVGGYFSITAKDLAEASEVARGCPSLKYGARVEVRQIFEMAGAPGR
jgi:hypothetical protein